jgi:hypothetical protein
MQHRAAQRMVLHFLHQCQPLGPLVILDRQIHQHVFRYGMMRQILHVLGIDFQALGFLLATVNYSRDASARAQLLDSAATGLRPGKSIQ